MAYGLHPATMNDVEAIASIFGAAFADDHIMSHFFPNVPKELVYRRDRDLFRDWLSQGDIYGGRFTKAVDKQTGYDSPISHTPQCAHEYCEERW